MNLIPAAIDQSFLRRDMRLTQKARDEIARKTQEYLASGKTIHNAGGEGMRDIKFRHWDGETMLDWMCICQTAFNMRSVSDQRQATQTFTPLMYSVMARSYPNSDLMQYTGLKDKNGVEIYEGDLLTSTDYPFQGNGEYNYHGIVQWVDGGFYRTLRCVNPEKRGISDGIAERLETDDVELMEVIGNIHENPELLGGV